MSNLRQNLDYLATCDPEIAEAVRKELNRQRRNIELIASENFVSPAVMAAAGTVLTNKYAEGYPGKRYYSGCKYVDQAEELAVERAKKLFGANFANVQPHSGAQANTAVFLALLQPGDKVLGMSLDNGGHLTHGSPVNLSGLYYKIIPYSVDPLTHYIDYDGVERLAMTEKPKLIIAGASAYPREIDFKRFGGIAKKCGAYLMVDMAHIAGLVAAGLHQNPLPYADMVTTTTHKTLRGPRGGLILCNDEEMAKKMNKAVFPGTQGGPLMHTIAAKAVCFMEALDPAFKKYQNQILKNAKALADALISEGVTLVSGGTDNHLMIADVRKFGITGKEMERRLDCVHITANKNAIPFDPEKPFVTSGIRLGTPAVTSRGFTETDMEIIADCIYLTATDFDSKQSEITAAIDELCAKYPLYD